MTDRFSDTLSLAGILLGYENLMENREQSRQNDVQSANDRQAAYLLQELKRLFDEQNVMIKSILEAVAHENHQGND